MSRRASDWLASRVVRKVPQEARNGDRGRQYGVLDRLAGRKRNDPWSMSRAVMEAASEWRRRKTKANRQGV